VEKTGPVLDLVVRTAGRGVYYEPLDLNHLALCELPDYKKLHVLTYNLAQRAAVRVRREEMEAAWADVNALDQMAGQVRRWPTLAAQMVAAGLSNAYVNALEDFLKKAPVPPSVLDHLPVPLPESTAPDMERALSMEEAALVQLAAGLGSDGYPGFSEGVRLAMDQGDRGRTLTSLLPPVIQYYWRPFLMPEDLAAIREKMALAKADAARPYPQYLMVGSGLARSWETDPGGLITSMMIPDFDQLYRVAAQAQARRELAAAALAVKAFRAQRNAWPETLADLAPRYIAALPPDALTGKPVQLEKSGTGIVLFVQPGSANDPKSQRLQFQLTP
jgi:hypothetical protein